MQKRDAKPLLVGGRDRPAETHSHQNPHHAKRLLTVSHGTVSGLSQLQNSRQNWYIKAFVSLVQLFRLVLSFSNALFKNMTLDVISHPRTYERATETTVYLRSQLPEVLQKPKVAIVCGSGLGGLADTIEDEPKVELPYENVPNMPRSTGKYQVEGTGPMENPDSGSGS